MKRYVRATTVSKESISMLRNWAEQFKHHIIDLDNHKVVIVMDRGMTESTITNKGTMYEYLNQNGFNVSLEKGNFDYIDVIRYRTFGGGYNDDHVQKTLKGRFILTVTW